MMIVDSTAKWSRKKLVSRLRALFRRSGARGAYLPSEFKEMRRKGNPFIREVLRTGLKLL